MILTLTMNPAVDMSASVERVFPAHKLRCSNSVYDPGGGGINVARVANRLGERALAIHTAGGMTGSLLGELLSAEHLEHVAVPVAGETRQNINILERSTGQEYRFVMEGAALEPDEIDACLAFVRGAGSCGFLVASGSLPPGVPADFLRCLVPIAGSLGAKLVVDSSGAALKGALGPGLYLIKPSLREMETLAERQLLTQLERVEAARSLIQKGQAQIVALTLGADGALLVMADCCWHAMTSNIAAVGTVGSGDSFLAALVVALVRSADPEHALRQGVAAGAAALLTSGTKLCQRADIERLAEQVLVRRLD